MESVRVSGRTVVVNRGLREGYKTVDKVRSTTTSVNLFKSLPVGTGGGFTPTLLKGSKTGFLRGWTYPNRHHPSFLRTQGILGPVLGLQYGRGRRRRRRKNETRKEEDGIFGEDVQLPFFNQLVSSVFPQPRTVKDAIVIGSGF